MSTAPSTAIPAASLPDSPDLRRDAGRVPLAMCKQCGGRDVKKKGKNRDGRH